MSARLAIVTGTTSGIGRAVAQQLLDRGWTVVGIARRHGAIAHGAYRHLAIDLSEVDAAAASIEREAGADRGRDRVVAHRAR